MSQRSGVSSLFYGHSAELIAEWCGVSIETAKRWKRGDRQPSLSAAKLFALYRNGQVLGTEWREWRVHSDRLIDPEGFLGDIGGRIRTAAP